jgi:hypothetical protein
VRALAEAMFSHESGPPAQRLDALVRELDDYASFASRTLRFGLLAMLEVLRFAPLILLWRFATFESLALGDRVRVLERMERSRIVPLMVVFAAYKAILCLLYFEHPEEQRDMGYTGARRRWRAAVSLVPLAPQRVAHAAE